jgi:heme-degrading monooxygenase HmoA
MRTVAIPDYKSTAGNMEAYFLPRTLDDRADFVMLTFWESLEAIKAFNDDDINVANHYEMDDRPSLNPTA